VDVRIIAATNADLPARIREGRFRGDLYHRLNVIPIRVPPLRERLEDIPPLWDRFVRELAGEAPVRSTPELIQALLRRSWLGNVRELSNLARRIVLLRRSDVLDQDDLPEPDLEELAAPAAPESPGTPRSPGPFLGELPEGGISLPEVEREIIVRALARHGGNRTRAAEYLGIARHVLLYRLEKYGIQ